MRNTKGRKGVEKSLYGTQKRSNINDLRTLLSRLCQKEDDRGGWVDTAARMCVYHGVPSEFSHQNLKTCYKYDKG